MNAKDARFLPYKPAAPSQTGPTPTNPAPSFIYPDPTPHPHHEFHQ
jgi:hypothetical protein